MYPRTVSGEDYSLAHRLAGTTLAENWLVHAFLGFWRMRRSPSLSPIFSSWR